MALWDAGPIVCGGKAGRGDHDSSCPPGQAYICSELTVIPVLLPFPNRELPLICLPSSCYIISAWSRSR